MFLTTDTLKVANFYLTERQTIGITILRVHFLQLAPFRLWIGPCTLSFELHGIDSELELETYQQH